MTTSQTIADVLFKLYNECQAVTRDYERKVTPLDEATQQYNFEMAQAQQKLERLMLTERRDERMQKISVMIDEDDANIPEYARGFSEALEQIQQINDLRIAELSAQIDTPEQEKKDV